MLHHQPIAGAAADRLEHVVVAAGKGDETAWSAIVLRFRGRVMRVARSHGLNPYQADDVAQETWLRLYRSIESVRDPLSLGAWIETTARRESLRTIVSRRREELTGEEIGVERGAEDDVDDVLEERREALARGLAKLNGRQRALIESLVAEPAPSYAELSARMGIPIGSIGPTRGRCVERLRRELAPSHAAA
jgi:RNA polymerase sigma factor (sigma-70 family)